MIKNETDLVDAVFIDSGDTGYVVFAEGCYWKVSVSSGDYGVAYELRAGDRVTVGTAEQPETWVTPELPPANLELMKFVRDVHDGKLRTGDYTTTDYAPFGAEGVKKARLRLEHTKGGCTITYGWPGHLNDFKRSFTVKAMPEFDRLCEMIDSRLVGLSNDAHGFLPKPLQYLDLSTCHITQKDSEIFTRWARRRDGSRTDGVSVFPYEYEEGFFVVFSDDGDWDRGEAAKAGLSWELCDLIERCLMNSIFMIRFDCDGEQHDELPSFDW